MEIKIINPNVAIPKYATEGSSGLDLMLSSDELVCIPPLLTMVVPTGIAIYIEDKMVTGSAFIRSSLSLGGIVLKNGVGVVDSDYQGEIKLVLWNTSPDYEIELLPYQRIAQLVLHPIIRPELKVVKEFSRVTARGTGGLGSTGSGKLTMWG